MSSSIGKRRREQQKREKAQEKAERKAARLTTGDEVLTLDDEGDGQPRSETQLIEELGALQQTFGADQISLEDFEEQRDRIQAELQRLSQ